MVRLKRPRTLQSVTPKVKTHEGNMYITITYQEPHTPCEVFINMGKADACTSVWTQALSRSVSAGLRGGVAAEVFVEQLRGLSCIPMTDVDGFVRSPADALSRVLEEFIGTKLPAKGEVVPCERCIQVGYDVTPNEAIPREGEPPLCLYHIDQLAGGT